MTQPSHSGNSVESSVTSIYAPLPPQLPHDRVSNLKAKLVEAFNLISSMQHTMHAQNTQTLEALARLAPPPTATAPTVPSPTHPPLYPPAPLPSPPDNPPAPTSSTQPKLVLDSLTAARRESPDQFSNWLSSTFRKIAINPLTRPALHQSGVSLLPDMAFLPRLIIFDSLVKALDPVLPDIYITPTQLKSNDALSLLTALETVHGHASQNAVTAHQDRANFALISRETKDETMDQYLTRYKTLYQRSGQSLSNQQLAIHYLLSLQNSSFQSIILAIGEGEKEPWFQYGLEATHHKAVAHLELLHSPNLSLGPDPPVYPATSRRSARASTSQPTSKSSSASSAPPSTDSVAAATANLRARFPTGPSTSDLLAFNRTNHFRCDLHPNPPGTTHSFLNCRAYQAAAVNLGYPSVWNAARDANRATMASNRSNSSNASGSVPPAPAPSPAPSPNTPSSQTNQNNEKVTGYMMHCRSVLRAEAFNPSSIPSTPAPIPTATPLIRSAIPDSGCHHHISPHRSDFTDLTIYAPGDDRPRIQLADDSTSLPVVGHGLLDVVLGQDRVRLMALYVPSIPTTLLSISQHVKYAGCSFIASDNGAYLTFPTTITTVDASESDFTIPLRSPTGDEPIVFDESKTDPAPAPPPRPTSPSSGGTPPSPRIFLFPLSNNDHLLIDRSHGKARTKARRVRIPRIDHLVSPPPLPKPSTPSTSPSPSPVLSPPSPIANSITPSSPSTVPAVPPLPVEARPNSALPKRLNITTDRLLQSIGFLKPDRLLKLLPTLFPPDTIHIQEDVSPAIPSGATATIPSTKRSTSPVPIPPTFGAVWHVDIGFGPSKAIGGARYCLFFVDRATRFKYVFPLKDLTSDLSNAMRQFITAVGRPNIGELHTDFDEKIIGGPVRTLLNEHSIPILAAPPRRQSQNGLVERHWQTIVKMARNWLKAALLPSNFWWFAINRAVEVSNTILPTYHQPNSPPATPFELVYKKKPDPRNLIPLFSVAAVKVDREQGGRHLNKFRPQSIQCIAVGLSHKSDSVLFYHPPSKQLLHSSSYRFDTYLPAGPQFNLAFDADFVFNTRADLDNSIHRPTSHESNSTVYVTLDGHTSRGVIIDPPINENTDPFFVQLDNDDIVEVMSSSISYSDPTTTPSDIPPATTDPPHLPWIKSGAKVTLIPPGSTAPKQGYLIHSSTVPGEWEFIIGRKKTNPSIPLPEFEQNIHSLLRNKKLFQGWKNLRLAASARLIKSISNVHARHISAKDLTVLRSPSSLTKHSQLPEPDKALWDSAYAEEYHGLEKLGTWRAVPEDEYQTLKHVIKSKFVPTMAISTIKYDGDGNPSRCKYRIVALGNLDPHHWDKQDCFAPVLSQLEHRCLLALAVRNKCIPKSGDVSQAFCQGVLPDDEEYYVKAPPGCPLTQQGGYLKLLRTLYGLKRSPRHWYEKARSILLDIGFTQCPHAPCIFVGHLIDGEPPIYLGLYVDDFIYFSESTAVEKLFEHRFGSRIKTDFNGRIGYFLGINHRIQEHPDGHLTIHLHQEAFIDSLLAQHHLDKPHINTKTTPYKSGLPVDKIANVTYPPSQQAQITSEYQQIVGSLNWLATSTRLDIAPITNLLAKHSSNPSEGHLAHCKHVLKYLKGSKSLGISFSSTDNDALQSFLKFPIAPTQITALTDANWGPQDQSVPRSPSNTPQLDLFKTRSLSGYLIWLGGPLHWSSKRQAITARSSAEAEIYATDECVKQLQHLHHIFEDLNVLPLTMPGTTDVYNDNSACVYWAHSMTSKGLRHIQIRENAVRESIQSKLVDVKHIAGAINLADLFTKEQKCSEHFLLIRDICMSDSSNIH